MTLHGATPPAAPRELLPLIRVVDRDARPGRAPATAPSRDFRFFDNRQKYLLFVNTCSEKEVVARRVGMELAHIHPRPPAVRVFDAGMGDGTVLTRVMREMHRRFATVPFYVVAKEISPRRREVVAGKWRTVSTSIRPRSWWSPTCTTEPVAGAEGARRRALDGWHGGLAGRHHCPRLRRADRGTGPFLARNWQARHSPKTGIPSSGGRAGDLPQDFRFLLDDVIPA